MRIFYRKTPLCLGLFLSVISIAFSQTDSLNRLYQELRQSTQDSSQVLVLSKLARHYLQTDIDSSFHYIQRGKLLAEKINFLPGQVEMLNLLGNYYENKSDYPQALEIYNQALQIAQQTNDLKGFAILYNNIGMVHIRQGRYDVALPMMIQALKTEEILGNHVGIAQSYNNIGVIYFYQQQYDKATEYFEKSIVVHEKTQDTLTIKQAINNLGAIYDYLQQYDQAIAQYQKALDLNTATNNRKEMSINLHNLAVAYFKKSQYALSESYYQQSIQLKKEINDYTGMALSYFNYGEMLRNNHQLSQAQEYFRQAIDIAEEKGLKETQQKIYASLAEMYQTNHDYQTANLYLHKYIAVKDSLLNTENSRILAETEAKYQTEKKEKELVASQMMIAEKEYQIQKQNMLIFGTLTLTLLLAAVGYLVYQQQRLKNKQLQKENELTEALHQIALQNQLQEQRLQISRDLHDNIGAQLTFIISSLDQLKYSLREKNNSLSNQLQNIREFTTQTIFELRDTIWAMNSSNITLEDLRSRITNFIAQAEVFAQNIDFKFELNKPLEEYEPLSSLAGMNLYRIIQEALNNSLKYAQARHITVEINTTEWHLIVRVLDDGMGFDKQQVHAGNGLYNMQKRAQLIGAEFTLHTSLGQGTAVVIKLPKNPVTHYQST